MQILTVLPTWAQPYNGLMSHPGLSRNTPSHVMLQKPQIHANLKGHLGTLYQDCIAWFRVIFQTCLSQGSDKLGIFVEMTFQLAIHHFSNCVQSYQFSEHQKQLSSDEVNVSIIFFVWQTLDLESIKTHHWNIQWCSAVTGEKLLDGIDWIISDIASRIFTMD